MTHLVFQEGNIDKDFDDHGAGGRLLEVESSFFLPLSVVFILPFLVIEYNTIRSYGLRWFQMWNIIDAFSYILQVFSFNLVPIHGYVFPVRNSVLPLQSGRQIDE